MNTTCDCVTMNTEPKVDAPPIVEMISRVLDSAAVVDEQTARLCYRFFALAKDEGPGPARDGLPGDLMYLWNKLNTISARLEQIIKYVG